MLPPYGGQAIDLPITKRIVELVTRFTRLIVAIMFSLSSNRPQGAVFALFASPPLPDSPTYLDLENDLACSVPRVPRVVRRSTWLLRRARLPQLLSYA
jgi:hypothetical protein